MCESAVLSSEQASVGMIFISKCGMCKAILVSGDWYMTHEEGVIAESESVNCKNCGGANFDVPKLYRDTKNAAENEGQSEGRFATTRLSRIDEISIKEYLEMCDE